MLVTVPPMPSSWKRVVRQAKLQQVGRGAELKWIPLNNEISEIIIIRSIIRITRLKRIERGDIKYYS